MLRVLEVMFYYTAVRPILALFSLLVLSNSVLTFIMTMLFLLSRYGRCCSGTSIRYSQGEYLCLDNTGDDYFDGDETYDDVDNNERWIR